LLQLGPGERLLMPGIGTGLDLPYVSDGVQITSTDLSSAMLHQGSAARSHIRRSIMDAQSLAFPDAVFDAVLLSLILSVVPDGAAAFSEGWRVLRPGGRVVIFDKFLPEAGVLSPTRRMAGAVIAWLGTDPNRRLSDILNTQRMRFIERDEPSLLRGQYRVVVLRKPLGEQIP
jgi:ubiquinone/menaquinone biosynthesis C-methylase UbiE